MHYVQAKGILSASNGMNLYRGCQHGCIYCDSRSLCYNMPHAFEDIAVKENGPGLLEQALKGKRKRCMIGTGSMSDPYLPLEETEQVTRRCLEVIERYGFGVSLLTKSDLVVRDLPLLQSINRKAKAVVCTTLTTYDEALCRLIEPHVATTRRRVEVLKLAHEAGLHTGVWLCPILPFINDTEENLRGLLRGCFDAGAEMVMNFGMGVTLREGDRSYFYAALDRHFPGMKERYIRAFGESYQCPSPHASQLEKIFREEPEECFAWLMQFEDRQAAAQLSLF